MWTLLLGVGQLGLAGGAGVCACPWCLAEEPGDVFTRMFTAALFAAAAAEVVY